MDHVRVVWLSTQSLDTRDHYKRINWTLCSKHAEEHAMEMEFSLGISVAPFHFQISVEQLSQQNAANLCFPLRLLHSNHFPQNREIITSMNHARDASLAWFITVTVALIVVECNRKTLTKMKNRLPVITIGRGSLVCNYHSPNKQDFFSAREGFIKTSLE